MRLQAFNSDCPKRLQWIGAAAACALALGLAACGTATIKDAVPGARRTGTYPNLNIPQKAATEQLTDEEAAAAAARLNAVRNDQESASAKPASEAERLRRLGQTHVEEALEEIEN